MVINCTVNVEENVIMTLSQKKSSKRILRQLKVDNKKIKLLSTNVFNITNLTKEDDGIYYCSVCGDRSPHTIILSISNNGNYTNDMYC